MRPAPGELLHFSEDPTLTRFAPHVAATAQQPEPYVWAVDADNAPGYWFPRQCPRAMAWVTGDTLPDDRDRILGPGGGQRLHAVEYGWLEAMRTTQLYAYRLPAAPFRPFPAGSARPHARVATEPIVPLGPPEPVGDLLALHDQAGIQLRVLPELHTLWRAVVESTLGHSGIRLANARPAPTPTPDPGAARLGRRERGG
jgi:hypothetical protein